MATINHEINVIILLGEITKDGEFAFCHFAENLWLNISWSTLLRNTSMFCLIVDNSGAHLERSMETTTHAMVTKSLEGHLKRQKVEGCEPSADKWNSYLMAKGLTMVLFDSLTLFIEWNESCYISDLMKILSKQGDTNPILIILSVQKFLKVLYQINVKWN